MATWVVPYIFTSGQVLTSTDMNNIMGGTGIGDLAYLYGDTGFISPSLINSWTNSYASGYRKVGNLVILRGQLNSPTGTTSSTAFNLPAGYVPSATVNQLVGIPGAGAAPPTVAGIYILGGAVTFYGYASGGVIVSMDTVIFSVI